MKFVQSKAGKVVFARLMEGEDLLETITKAAESAQISAGFFFLIGTLKKANLGFFHEGEYKTIKMNKPLEIVSCLGNTSLREQKIFAHAHIAVSDDKCSVFGGHVMPGCIIGVAGELVLTEATDIQLVKEFDEKTGLYLWAFNEPSAKNARGRLTSI